MGAHRQKERQRRKQSNDDGGSTLWPGKHSYKGYGGGTRICGLAEDQHEEHRRPGRDLTGEQGERGTTRRDGAQRAECAHGGCVDQEERAETSYADAGISEHLAAPVGPPVEP